jgi:outer membrane protein OmpA-like peptidoglycan-associated protein
VKKVYIYFTVLVVAMFGLESMAGPNEVVISSSGQPIIDSFGGCVRSSGRAKFEKCELGRDAAALGFAHDDVVVYFGFDSSRITKKSQNKLLALINKVKHDGYVLEAKVYGYTDRVGNEKYNLILSQKRAAAVEAFLEKNGEIISNISHIEGRGVDDASICSKNLSRNELIKCLWKDRRVEVKIYLTK